MDLGDVTSETIERAQLEGKAFEQFVRQLLDHELELRHAATAKIKGPVANYHGDDKRDLVVETDRPPKTPREDFRHALTWDDVGQVWYSCKGGRGWKKSFLDELGQRAVKRGTPPTTKVQHRPPEAMLDHLERGARLVFVVAEGTIDDNEFLDQIENLLGWWFDQIRPTRRPATLRGQLDFIDANALADFLRKYRPSNLSEDFVNALGVGVPDGFILWQQWADELGGRDLPEFEADAKREEIFAAVANPGQRTLRVFGPPGAGKTRVIHEGLARLGPDAKARVRYSSNLDATFGIRNWLRGAGRIYLVLDELRTADVEALTETFEANAPEGARLFLIGTSDDGARPEPGRAFDIDKLDDDAIERMIQHEFSTQAGRLGQLRRQTSAPSTDQVTVVRRLSENYPWYAVLLARALANDSDSLERPDDETARWSYGARRVLAGSPDTFASAHDWDREAVLRAKCLLVAMMTRDLELDWETIWDQHAEKLALAIGETLEWETVRDREHECHKRQILRESGIRAKRRYVSPNNLARIILQHFFTDPDLGPKVRKHAPEFRGTLLAIATSLHSSRAVIDNLARGEWHELLRRVEHEGIDSVASYLDSGKSKASYLAAIEAPEAAARAVSAALLHFGEAELAAASGIRSTLRMVLTHVIHRKITPEAFLLVETALFHLAGVEDEPWASNATGVWRSLFLPGLHSTHQAWPLRLERLDLRLSDSDPRRRALAIHGLGLAVEPREGALGYVDDDKRDGEWPLPRVGELRAMKQQLWTRLLDACGDEVSALVDQARRAVIVGLRSGLGRGLDAAELLRLAAMVPTWTPEQRQKLAESIADIRRYDLAEFTEFGELMDGLVRLETALAPTDLHERIVAQVGLWHPGPWAIDDTARPKLEQSADHALAGELLATPEMLDWAMAWLVSPHALRRRSFFQALGFMDARLGLRARIVEHVHAGANAEALCDYMLGVADAQGSAALESWIASHADDRALAPAFIQFVAMQPPSEERLLRLRALLALGGPAEGLVFLPYGQWPKHGAPGPMLALIRDLVEREDLAHIAMMLIIETLDRDLDATANNELLDRLTQVLEFTSTKRVVIAYQQWFERGMLALAKAGRFAAVASLVLRTLDTRDEPANVGMGHDVLRTLLRGGHANQLWPHFAEALLEDPISMLAWQLAAEHLLEFVHPQTVLTWVGAAERRATRVAGLTTPHGPALDEVTRQLLIGFGPEGEVARVLANRARSTPGVVAGGIGVFMRQQSANAHQWANDVDPRVRSWAETLENEFRERADEHDALREFRRKHG